MYRIFAKTILSAYSSLEFFADKIDVLVRRRVAAGYSGNGICTSAQRQIEEIVVLMDKKANLINLRLLADEVLASTDRASRRVLEDKYIKKITPEETMEQLGISRRTFFRRLDRAEESFGKGCFARGCDTKWFEQNYFDQSWLKDLFDSFCQKEKAKQKR